MAQSNETKNVELTALNRAYMRAALNLKAKSVERAMKNESNPDIIRIRVEEMKVIQECIGKL